MLNLGAIVRDAKSGEQGKAVAYSNGYLLIQQSNGSVFVARVADCLEVKAPGQEKASVPAPDARVLPLLKMSRSDYRKALIVSLDDPPFESLIMAALMKADTVNFAKLQSAFPEISEEWHYQRATYREDR